MTLKVLAGVRDVLIIVAIMLTLGFGAYTYGQIDGMADRINAPATDVPCDDTYPDALPC